MFDSHCHLDYLDDPEAALGEFGLSGVVCIGADPEHAHSAVKLAERFHQVWATTGLHPTEASRDSAEVRAEIEALSRHPRVVAIGESGLDYYWDAASPEQQRGAFEWQLKLARERDLPIVIHVRDKQGQDTASREVAETLTHAGWPRGILHCFNGHAMLLRAGLDLGFYVSFAGNLTYKNARDLQEAARFVPRERLLIETDAPFLAPVPKRGRPNRPGYVRYTLQFLAELLGLSEAQLEAITDDNARRVYGLSQPAPRALPEG
ncbi:TatD family hydrolase [Deinococcus peraridilitoris]|uniref:Hydrolase, TatD family n=1 Tax=Deinococcus peraridilitoris (strain DSM 19664 / LMG 22246 / CIP 109416 / KR-200) TaxID=937777 RepID=L0A3I4_DEIPD|nr:TatD family hydrolase [Deinococcus peraridilitoris]AFZ68458.1 hydrolase, TatD family [Deinococcus peraridilitoris DSM 19664]